MDKPLLKSVEILILEFLATKKDGKVQYHSLANHFCNEGRADDCIFLGSTLRNLRKENFILDELDTKLENRVYTITKLGKERKKNA